MGFHKNLLIVAKKLNIKTCFSVHDFFPICPKVTMYRNSKLCDTITDCSMCNICNKTALSISKIRILQSPIYRVLKNTHIVKLLRKGHRDNFLGENVSDYDKGDTSFESRNYIKLREFYKSVISNMDMIHYNSTITKNVYEKYMGVYKSFVISISHGDIKDNRKRRKYNDFLKLSYLGPYGGGKGFFYLKAALDELLSSNNNIILNVFFERNDLPPYIKTHKRYSYNQLSTIFNDTDALVVPSIWYETFGYTVIEALSFAVPVIISSNVGAKDVLPKGAGIIYNANSKEELKNAICSLTKERLRDMNATICDSYNIMTLKDMAEQIYEMYRKMIY